jgi:hypothetical protein
MRAENKLKYAYLLTPEGIRAKLELTRNYLARKEQEYITMKAEIEAMRKAIGYQGRIELDPTKTDGITRKRMNVSPCLTRVSKFS